MRSRAGLKRWPITTQQRAAMRAAQQHVADVLARGCTPEQVAQAQAEIEASRYPRQPQLLLPVRA